MRGHWYLEKDKFDRAAVYERYMPNIQQLKEHSLFIIIPEIVGGFSGIIAVNDRRSDRPNEKLQYGKYLLGLEDYLLLILIWNRQYNHTSV